MSTTAPNAISTEENAGVYFRPITFFSMIGICLMLASCLFCTLADAKIVSTWLVSSIGFSALAILLPGILFWVASQTAGPEYASARSTAKKTLLAAMIVAVATCTYAGIRGEAASAQQQDHYAHGARKDLLNLGLAQQKFLQENGTYAGNLNSLIIDNPQLKDWDQIGDWQFGSADGHGFLISLTENVSGVRMTYGMTWARGHLSTSCNAPEHSGCVDGQWAAPGSYLQQLQNH